MRTSLKFVLGSTACFLLIAIGCSAPSADGTGLGKGKSSTSSSGKTEEEEESSSSSGNGSTTSSSGAVTGDCSNREKVDDRPACDSCVRSKCCKEVLACDDTNDCKALQDCIDGCGGELICQLGCAGAHEKGNDALTEVASCSQVKCKTECPSTAGGTDGGLEDPFGDL